MLGLADQIGRDVHRVGGVVGEDRDLGRPGLGVDADLRAADPLGRGDVDVARPGDHVDRREFGAVGVGAAVGQQRDGLRAADRPHLVDAEQRRRGEDGRVRQAVEIGLRRAGDDQRVHARGLRGHHVHHHARRVDGVAARHVEADPLDRHPALGDGRAGRERRGGVGAPLIGVHGAGAFDRDLQRGAHVGVRARSARASVARPARERSRDARRRTTRRTPGRPRRPVRRPRRRSAGPWARRRRRRRRRAAGRPATAPHSACGCASRCARSAPAIHSR